MLVFIAWTDSRDLFRDELGIAFLIVRKILEHFILQLLVLGHIICVMFWVDGWRGDKFWARMSDAVAYTL
jgi:hypothetical protein